MKLSKHFDSKEFECKGKSCCSHSAPMSMELVYALEILRFEVRKKSPKAVLHINSGFRCRTHNKAIGGAENSQHCLGMAVDVKTPEGFTDQEFFELCKGLNIDSELLFSGIGLYEGRIHVDIRQGLRVTWGEKQ